jgi:hypothetical protein
VIHSDEFKRRLTALNAARAAVDRNLDALRILAYRPEPIQHPDDRPVPELIAEYGELKAAEEAAAGAFAALIASPGDGPGSSARLP